MTNSYDVAHGLSQCPPGPLEPVEVAQQDDTLARTGNTARDQEMYAAGIRTGEENAKHNAAIRAGVPDGWKLVPIEPTIDMIVDGQDTGSVLGPRVRRIYAAMLNAAPAAPGVSTVEDAQDAPIALDRLADYIADNWPDKKYGLEEICQRLNATWPGAFMPAAPAAGDALDARQLMALADAVVVQWQREDKMPQMAWGFREFLVAGMQALIDSNCTPHDGDGLVDALARLAYYYAVELESATRNADSDRLEEIARSITAKLKGEIRAAIAAQRKGDA